VPADGDDWLRAAPGGSLLSVLVVPRSSHPGLVGVHGGLLRLRVTAPPEGGAANREVLRLLAAALGVPAADVALERGAGGRRKRVRILHLATDEARRRLAAHLAVDTSRAGN